MPAVNVQSTYGFLGDFCKLPKEGCGLIFTCSK